MSGTFGSPVTFGSLVTFGSAIASLIERRREWRSLHQSGDHIGAERVLREAGVAEKIRETLDPRLSPNLREKLEAYGRDWEKALVVAASPENANVFECRWTLEPSRIESFQEALEARLAEPRIWGALLFVESAQPLALDQEQWNAIGHVICAARRSMDEIDWSSLPGLVRVDGFRKEVA